MKQRHFMLASLSALVAIFALLTALVSSRPRISLTLVEYKRWPHGAMLLLSNGTSTTIRYLSERNETPAGSLVLCLQKATHGWTNSSLAIKSSTGLNPATRKTTEFFYAVDPAAPPKPGDRLYILQPRELGPGESVKFFVRLEPGGMARQVGTVYLAQSTFDSNLRPWLRRLQQWCRIQPSPTGQRKVWCPTPLSMPPEPTDSVGN